MYPMPHTESDAVTTIASNTAALSSLVSLYGSENGSGAKLTSDQVSSIESMVEGSGGSTSTGLSALLGTSSTSTDDMNSILDNIAAQAGTTTTTAAASDSAPTTTTATTQQQKAAALMQSVYQSQQANLFTLLG